MIIDDFTNWEVGMGQNIAKEAKMALAEARSQALASGKTIVEYSEGYLVSVTAAGVVNKALELVAYGRVDKDKTWRLN